MTAAVDFRNVDIVFGKETARALAMIDKGATRAEILAETGAVLGCAGCNLTVEEGEISVLMGLSGSGKSTLLRAVNLLNVPVRGHVYVKDGAEAVDVVSCDEATLRRIRQKRVAMVFQQFALLPWRTVEENVGFGLELAGIPDKERKERVARQLSLVGLDQWAKKYAHELSGGMQQRVALVRALALHAPLLVMDEPFAALDEITRAGMRVLLNQLVEGRGVTVFFITHSIAEAVALSDRVLVSSPRPARIVADITIDLPRPRAAAVEDDTRFVELCAEVRHALHGGMS